MPQWAEAVIVQTKVGQQTRCKHGCELSRKPSRQLFRHFQYANIFLLILIHCLTMSSHGASADCMYGPVSLAVWSQPFEHNDLDANPARTTGFNGITLTGS